MPVRGARSGDAAQQRGAYGASRGAAGDSEADLLAPTHREQPQRTDGIVDFVNHLKHPFHRQSLGARLTANREWDHNLSSSIGLPCCLGLRRLHGHAANSRPEP
jgi:hypothetical protein